MAVLCKREEQSRTLISLQAKGWPIDTMLLKGNLKEYKSGKETRNRLSGKNSRNKGLESGRSPGGNGKIRKPVPCGWNFCSWRGNQEQRSQVIR